MSARSLGAIVAALLVSFTASWTAVAAPVLDTMFGAQGVVRVGEPSGDEDVANTSTMQPDGKLIVAGMSTGRQQLAFIVRFTSNGQRDAAFGSGGVRLLTPPTGYVWMAPVGVELLPDGSMIVVSTLYDRFVLTRLTPAGGLDAGFGTGGSVVFADSGASRSSAQDAPIRVNVQADGKLLVMTDASSSTGTFALRFRRFQGNGAVDTSFGIDGVRSLSNLPPNFYFGSARLAVAEPDGGFTLVARALSSIANGTYLVVRVTASGDLQTAFGGVGYVSGYDLGNPNDTPIRLARGADGYVVSGYLNPPSSSAALEDIVWRFDANGARLSSFGTNGRLPLGSYTGGLRAVTVMPDGDILLASRSSRTGNTSGVTVTRLGPNGLPRAVFGTNGSVDVRFADYPGTTPIGIHVDASSRIAVAGYAYSRIAGAGSATVERGQDVIAVGLTATGVPRTDFGRGDGTAAWNNPALSDDRIDTLLTDGNGRIIGSGFTNGNAGFGFLLTRLSANGTPDTTFGTGGRSVPSVFGRCVGEARTVLAADGSLVVSTGDGQGSFCQFGITTIFRVDAKGVLDSTFHPQVVASGGNAHVGLGIRPDGRIVYATRDSASGPSPTDIAYVVQQFLPDGSADTSFGTGGRVSIAAQRPADALGNMMMDLVVLSDGSTVFTSMLSSHTASTMHVVKVDATGKPVASFGSGGVATLTTPGLIYAPLTPPTLLALADGSFVALESAYTQSADGSAVDRFIHVVRFGSTGLVTSAQRLPVDPNSIGATAVALPDASVIIGRSMTGSGATLARLLPDDQFDRAFGGADGIATGIFRAISAMTIDASGRLLVAGFDDASALVARYRLEAGAMSVAAVEYYNVNLRHYFVTANAAEQRSIETGGAGPGWQRTGNDFRLWVPEVGVPVGAVPVCRFYGTPGRGPNSHFYTASPAECASVKRDPGWTYEGIAFYVIPPVNDQCPGSSAVWRAYNNGFASNDSNHRYSTQRELLQSMTSQGWSVEGVAFCGAAG